MSSNHTICDKPCDKLDNLYKYLPPEITLKVFRSLDIDTIYKLNLSNRESWMYLNNKSAYNANINYRLITDTLYLKCDEVLPKP